jgi:hypothetical protein
VRKHISLKTKLAAALRELAKIPRDHAELMTEDQVISLFVFDHGVYHVHGGSDEHFNLTPLLIRANREKTGKDVTQIRKTDRISKTQADFRQRILTPRDQRPAKKSRWGSRPFQKRKATSA